MARFFKGILDRDDVCMYVYMIGFGIEISSLDNILLCIAEKGQENRSKRRLSLFWRLPGTR
jgi:hypothetical protein